MNHGYGDIVDRIPERPWWWDENAVPRYCKFSPRVVANIYAREVVLAEIACQDCGRRFLVAFSSFLVEDSLAELVESNDLHYGDPPNIGCCPAGPTMNSVPIRVVEFWRSDSMCVWSRVPELERRIECDWADSSPSSGSGTGGSAR